MKDHTSVGLVGGLALMVAGIASAQVSPFQHTVRMATELEYDTNANHSAVAPASVLRFRTVPTYQARYATGENQFDFEGAVSLERSSNETVSQHRVDPRAKLTWQRSDPYGNWRAFVAVDRRAYRTTEVEERVPISVDGTRQAYLAGVDFDRDLNERTQASVQFRHDSVSFDVGVVTDYSLTSGSTRLFRVLSEELKVYAAVDGQSYRAKSGGPALALVGPSISDKTDVIGAVTGFQLNFGPFVELQADAGVTSYLQASRAEPRGSASVKYTRDRLQATFTWQRRPIVSAETSSLVQTSIIRMTAAYEVGARTRVRLEAATRKQREQGTRFSTFAISAHHEITQNWELTIRANLLKDESLTAGRVNGTRVSIGLVHAPPL